MFGSGDLVGFDVKCIGFHIDSSDSPLQNPMKGADAVMEHFKARWEVIKSTL